MENVSGIKDLAQLCVQKHTKGLEFSRITLLNGVPKVRYGCAVVKHKQEGVVYEHYGIEPIIRAVVENPHWAEDPYVVRFIGMSDAQQECCEFGIEFKEGDSEVIVTNTQLKTPQGGDRDISGNREEINENTQPEVANEENTQKITETTEELETDSKEVVESDDSGGEPLVVMDSTPEKSDEKVVPNFIYAAALMEGKSKNEAKIALEEYAREFSIELKRNMKFSNMLKDFQTQWESQDV